MYFAHISDLHIGDPSKKEVKICAGLLRKSIGFARR